MNTVGTEISSQPEVKTLWTRESEYLYVVNRGETPRDFFIAYSGATSIILTTAATVILTLSQFLL